MSEGVCIKPACVSACAGKEKKSVPRVGDTLDDGLVSPHGYAGVLRGDDDRRGDGVRRSSHIYHTHRRQIEKT